MYGLKLPDKYGQEGPSKKPTCFRTTKQELANGLQLHCNGKHVHVPIEGNAPGGKQRSAMAESYPDALARRLAELIQAPPADQVLAAEEADEDMPDAEQALHKIHHKNQLTHNQMVMMTTIPSKRTQD